MLGRGAPQPDSAKRKPARANTKYRFGDVVSASSFVYPSGNACMSHLSATVVYSDAQELCLAGKATSFRGLDS